MSAGRRDGPLRRFLVGDLSDGEEPDRSLATGEDDERGDEEPIKAPWHFKVLVVGTVGYLIYRLIWVIFWLTGHAWRG